MTARCATITITHRNKVNANDLYYKNENPILLFSLKKNANNKLKATIVKKNNNNKVNEISRIQLQQLIFLSTWDVRSEAKHWRKGKYLMCIYYTLLILTTQT